MTPERWAQIEELFHRASGCDPKERAALLDENCRGDLELRQEVESLLSREAGSGNLVRAAVRSELERFGFSLIGEVVSHYRILDGVGGGGMGLVYRAEDIKLGRQVAIKFLPEESANNPVALSRFEREARSASALEHPNICPIYEFGEHEGKPFLVMQLLEGQTLRELLENRRSESSKPGYGAAPQGNMTLPLEQVLDLAIQIADGLQAAHQKGIIHRDIKPANMFITNESHLKILDFGLVKLAEDVAISDDLALNVEGSGEWARNVDPVLSRTGVAMGTAAYMSPEQVRGEKLDARTDLFSFGLVLYEMATGLQAFSGKTADVVEDAVLNRTPPPVRQLNPGLPPKLDAIIIKALEKDRQLRYQRAADLRADLQELKRDTNNASKIVDAIPRRVLPMHPWWRVNVALGVGGLIIASLILAVFFWWQRRSLVGRSMPRLVHKQITFVGDAYWPAISPDGKSVAYVIKQPRSDQKLIMQALPGGPSLELLHGDFLAHPKWSPDGSELMLDVSKDQGKTFGIFVVSRLGGIPRLIPANGYACWQPDGSQIVVANLRGVRLVNKLTGAEKQIPAPGYQWLGDVDCSAKAGMLLLLTMTSEKYQIWTMKPDGSEQRKLIEGESGITFLSPRWSSAGDAVYYFRKEGDTAELVRLPASGQSTGPSPLVSGLETGDYFTLSADGSQLAYTRRQSYSNLWLVELPAPGTIAKAHEKPLTSGTLQYIYPSISPDSRWVAFTIGSAGGTDAPQARGTKGNVYKMTIDGGQPVQLTFFNAAWTWSPAWSPDGREIAFICDQGGTPKVWIVDADGGIARLLDKTNASTSNYQLSWSPSPEILYQPPEIHNLRFLKVETQEERPLLSNDSKGWLVGKPIFSPDGKKIAILWNQRPGEGAWVITREGFSERLLYPWVMPFGWSADGNFIYALGHLPANRREILQIGLGDSKKPRSMITMPGDLESGTVSPDGRKIIVSVGEEKSDLWLMKDFDPQTLRAN